MAYIGRGIDNISQIEVLDLITFTNSAGPYNILKGAAAFIPSTVNSLLIEVDGIIQAPSSYTISGSTITFGVSMASTSTMNSMIHFGSGLITTPADGTVSTVKLEDGAVTGAKVNSTFDVSAKTVTLPASVSGLGTGITNAQLAGSIDVTSKITGVVPTANLGSGTASSSTILYGDQTYKAEPTTDLTSLRQDIITLALKQGVQENMTKHNLPSSAVVTFQADADFNLAGSTDVERNASKFISTQIVGTFPFTDDSYTELLIHSNTTDGNTTFTDSSHNARTITTVGTMTNSTTQAKFGTSSIYFNGGAAVDTALQFADSTDFDFGSGAFTIEFWGYNLNGANAAGLWGEDNQYYPPTQLVANTTGSGSQQRFWATASPGSSFTIMAAQSLGVTVADTWEHWAVTRDGNDWSLYKEGTRTTLVTDSGTIGTTSDALRLGGGAGSTGSPYGWIDEVRISKGIARYTGASYTVPTASTTTNATGTALGTTNVPSSAVTEVSGVMLMKNAYGTNTLGTDIKAYFTADNSNWTEAASYTDSGTFSDTTKMITLGKTTVTSGSDVRWKIVWANQVADTKIGEVYGIGTNY